MRAKRRGFLVVLEGIDGAGTTTQAALLRERLAGQVEPVVVTAEPSTGPIGALIRNVLRGRVTGLDSGGRLAPFDRQALALLFAADRLDHLACEVRPVLARGGVVICDRYVLSSLAYQGLDAPREWIADINRFAPLPDLTVFLDVPPDVALVRIADSRGGRDLFETSRMLERVAVAYREALAAGVAGPVAVVDGTVTRTEVADRVFSAVEPLLTQGAGRSRSRPRPPGPAATGGAGGSPPSGRRGPRTPRMR